MKINYKKLILFIVVTFVVGGLFSFFMPDMKDYYMTLNRPPLSPSGIVFPIAWSILYLLMAISLYIVSETKSLDIEKSYYYLHENDKIGNEQQERYEACIRKRKRRIPLQQITGKAWFMGYEFYVNDQVLIPRFDTEILVEEARNIPW